MVFNRCNMWIRFLAFIASLVVFGYSQETLEPVPGCIQFRIEFADSVIDENCQFTDQTYTDAVWGTSYQRNECKALGGQLIVGQYKTNSLLCPDYGHLYTACCTRYDCGANYELWTQYCEGQGLTFYGYCSADSVLVIGLGCMTESNPTGVYNNVSGSAQSTELEALNQIIGMLDQKAADDAATWSGMVGMLDIVAWQDENHYSQQNSDNQEIINGITAIGLTANQQLNALNDVRQQTIKARFEQSGLLGNIELIAEEQQMTMLHMDSVLMELKNAMSDSLYVDNSGISRQLAAMQNALLNATGTEEGDTSFGPMDDSTIGATTVDTVADFSGAYQQAIENAVDSIETPNYDSLAQMLLSPYSAIQESNTCPDFSFDVALPSAMGGQRIIDLKFCQLNVFGSNLWSIIRLILSILVNSWCALVLYRASLAVFSGTHKGTNWMNFA